MAVAQSELKKLTLRSGGVCAFPECRKPLTIRDAQSGEVTVLGHVAHIVAQQDNGPRGDPVMSALQRDKYENLVLLCTGHHQLVDTPSNFATWTVARLTALRDDHERWVEGRLDSGSGVRELGPIPLRTDTVYSTLLPVERMPRFLYRAETSVRDRSEIPDVQAGQYPLMVPYILHDSAVWAFQDFRDEDSPFASAVDVGSTERFEVDEMVAEPDQLRLVQQVLNRTLHKLAGRRDLALDVEHRRYYFRPSTPGEERREAYSSIQGRTSRLAVVWQPVIKARNERRHYWMHRAVSLGFVFLGDGTWCLAMRPEFHITSDSVEPYSSEKIGARVTKKKSRMFNADLLTELQFWRHYLGEGMPRLVMKFSETQAVHVSTTLLRGEVDWPGIPPEHDVNYSNVEYLDDLLTIAETLIPDEEGDWENPEPANEGSDEELSDADD